MEYYLLRNLGYDGMLFWRIGNNKDEAIARYQDEIGDIAEQTERLKQFNIEPDKGVILIEGNIIMGEDKEYFL